MQIFFHTIAIEPARWTPQRTSQDLVSILPHIASAGFRHIEVFEPHLTTATTSQKIKDAFRSLDLSPEILSSYIKLNPAENSSAQVDAKVEEIRARIDFYGFRGVRIFPGPQMNPADKPAVAEFTKRLERLVASLPGTDILLETHDHSLADDPETIIQIVRDLNSPSVGLLYQPTRPESEPALQQLALQLPFIRHIHLQNHYANGGPATLKEGVYPWAQIISQLDKNLTASLEFVPAGICTVDEFDLAATLLQARSEAAYFHEIAG